MEFCTNNGVLIAFKIIGYLIFIVKIIVPLLLIIMGIIDFAKALISNDEKSISDAISIFIRRFIAAVIIFFIPTLLNFVLDLVDGANETLGTFTNCTSCLLKPTSCETKSLGEDMPERQTEASGEQLEDNVSSSNAGKVGDTVNQASEGISNDAGNAAANLTEEVNDAVKKTTDFVNKAKSSNSNNNKSNRNNSNDSKRKLTINKGKACLKSNNEEVKIDCVKNNNYCTVFKSNSSGLFDSIKKFFTDKGEKIEKSKLYDPPCGTKQCVITESGKKIVYIQKCASDGKCIDSDNMIYSKKSLKSESECNN